MGKFSDDLHRAFKNGGDANLQQAFATIGGNFAPVNKEGEGARFARALPVNGTPIEVVIIKTGAAYGRPFSVSQYTRPKGDKRPPEANESISVFDTEDDRDKFYNAYDYSHVFDYLTGIENTLQDKQRMQLAAKAVNNGKLQ